MVVESRGPRDPPASIVDNVVIGTLDVDAANLRVQDPPKFSSKYRYIWQCGQHLEAHSLGTMVCSTRFEVMMYSMLSRIRTNYLDCPTGSIADLGIYDGQYYASASTRFPSHTLSVNIINQPELRGNVDIEAVSSAYGAIILNAGVE